MKRDKKAPADQAKGRFGRLPWTFPKGVVSVFRFHEFDRIEGEEIDLVLREKRPGNRRKGFVPSYEYNIVLHGTNIAVGSISLRIGNNENIYYGGHIGYGVHEAYRGRSFAYKACQLLPPVAKAHGFDTLVITCNPGNIPSRRTCEKLGARLVEIVDIPPQNDMYRAGERKKCRYVWRL